MRIVMEGKESGPERASEVVGTLEFGFREDASAVLSLSLAMLTLSTHTYRCFDSFQFTSWHSMDVLMRW
jgi:hypothetical protein